MLFRTPDHELRQLDLSERWQKHKRSVLLSSDTDPQTPRRFGTSLTKTAALLTLLKQIEAQRQGSRD